MPKQINTEDRNFDELAARFKRNIYDGLKGRIRLSVLERDFAECMPKPQTALWVLDAGGGQGQFSLTWAQAGHHVVICDISVEMLKLAELQASELGVLDKVHFLHCSIQALEQQLLLKELPLQFDVVLCHAVLEWVVEPLLILNVLSELLKPEGYLSLTFYNIHAAVYKNLLRGNFKKVKNRDFTGSRGSLTPTFPRDPEVVRQWLSALPFNLLCASGIRVFHDYIFDEVIRAEDEAGLLAMELQHSTIEPYKSLGRYIHFLLKKQ